MFKNILFSFIFLVVLTAFPVALEATSDNLTRSIDIQATTDQDQMIIEYEIIQNFRTSSRGIFLSLPKNQDGVWTEYEVKSVQKQRLESSISSLPSINTEPIVTSDQEQGTLEDGFVELEDFKNEPFEVIGEWNQFRFRIGDKDTYLPLGYYRYQFEIRANYNPENSYQFTFLRDWQDSISYPGISLSIDDQLICKGIEPDCNSQRTSYNLNSDKPALNFFQKYIWPLWPFGAIALAVSVLTYFAWHRLARDDTHYFSKDSPQFEPPELLPWEAQFILTDGKVDTKNTLLSYILWLNHHRYIKLEPTLEKDSKDKIVLTKLKDLPKDVLPAKFNKVVKLSIEKGLKAGVEKSKLSAGESENLHKQMSKSLAKYYSQRGLSVGVKAGIATGVGFTFFIIFALLANLLERFLIGRSYSLLIGFTFICLWLGLNFVVFFWSRLNQEGLKMMAYCHQYRYYLKKAERFKLDFSNNPKDGVQYYLKSVPYAASFGILAQFQKYFSKLMPDLEEVKTGSVLRANWGSVALYTPPSSGGGGFSGSSGGFSGGGGSW
jgi:uncharacterized membrane protein YgcG